MAEKSERMSFLLPLVAVELVVVDGEVGAACQSKSNSPPPPAVVVFSDLVAAVGDLIEDCVEVALTAEAERSSSKEEELRDPVRLVVAGPGPTSPPSKSTALGAAAVRVVREEEVEGDAAPAALEEGVESVADVLPSRMLGSDGGGPSFAHRLVSYLLRMKLSTLCSGGT